MKIAIIISSNLIDYPTGGMKSFVEDTYHFLNEKVDVDVWGVEKNGKKATVLFNIFANLDDKPRFVSNGLWIVLEVLRNRGAIIRENYDILYFHGIPLSFPFFGRESKVVNHVHGTNNPMRLHSSIFRNNLIMSGLYERYRRYVVRKSDMVLLAADSIGTEEFRTRHDSSRDKIYRIPNFIDPGQFYHIPKDQARDKLGLDCAEFVLVNTGRIQYGKNPELLIEVAKELKKTGLSTFKLFIIGTGVDSILNRLKNLITDHGLSDNVVLLGELERSEINLWLNASDIFLFTSRGEGFPLSLVESLVCGTPIVSTACKGVGDLVVPNVTGELTYSGKAMDLAKDVLKVRVGLSEYSTRAIEYSKNFSRQRILNELLDSFKSLMKQK